MFGASLKATNSSFQKGITFGRSICVLKVTKLAFIFEHPSYTPSIVFYVASTVNIQIISHRTRCMTRFYTVCLKCAFKSPF